MTETILPYVNKLSGNYSKTVTFPNVTAAVHNQYRRKFGNGINTASISYELKYLALTSAELLEVEHLFSVQDLNDYLVFKSPIDRVARKYRKPVTWKKSSYYIIDTVHSGYMEVTDLSFTLVSNDASTVISWEEPTEQTSLLLSLPNTSYISYGAMAHNPVTVVGTVSTATEGYDCREGNLSFPYSPNYIDAERYRFSCLATPLDFDTAPMMLVMFQGWFSIAMKVDSLEVTTWNVGTFHVPFTFNVGTQYGISVEYGANLKVTINGVVIYEQPSPGFPLTNASGNGIGIGGWSFWTLAGRFHGYLKSIEWSAINPTV